MALTNAQYDTIMREYDDVRLRHRRELDDRRREVYAALPRMAELDEEAADLAMQRARELLPADGMEAESDPARSKAAGTAFQEALGEIREEREALLQAHGWPADYLEPHDDCPLCHDTGYIGNEKCTCFLKKEIALLHAQSHLSEALTEDTFEQFLLDYYEETPDGNGNSPRADARHALALSRRFVQDFGKGEPVNLCFYGSVGVGKTFLTNCIAGELLNRGFSVLYQPSYELFESLGTYTFSPEHEGKALHDAVFSCDLLIIDDLGTELTNAFVASQLFLIINNRALQKKSTILSTNISPEAFADTFSERVSSRLLGSYQLVRLSGSDIRILKKLSNH